MTNAPNALLAPRRLLLEHLNIDESRIRSQDLEPAEVGIVGDSAHRGGYHCGRDRVVAGDYSVIESDRDRNGLTLDAAALDVGQFSVTKNGRTHNLQTFSVWCVSQCVARAPDTRDIREIIYSPDGKTVRRWDRLGRRSSGDESHLWHTHFSFFRDAIKAGRDQSPLFRRWLTTIGLIEGDDVEKDERAWLWSNANRLDGVVTLKPTISYQIEGEATRRQEPNKLAVALGDLSGRLSALQAGLAELQGRDWVNEQEVVDGVLAGLGARPEPEVAQALVAAGADPQRLAEALLALAPQPE